MKTTSMTLIATAVWCGCQVEDGQRGSQALALQAPQGLYGIDLAQDQLILVDSSDASQSVVGSLGMSVDSVGADFSCDGTLWAFSSTGTNEHSLYTVDLNTGAATVVQTFDTTGYSPGVGFEFGPDEKTLYWRTNDHLATLDIASGTVTPVSSYGGNSVSLTINPDTCDDFLSSSANRLNGYSTDGVETAGPATVAGISSLAAAPDGTLYAHAGARLYSIDIDTGAGNLIGNLSLATPGLAFGPDEVTCTPSCPFCDPRTQGFWKRQCAGPHPSGEHERLPDYVAEISVVEPFDAVDSVESMCERLHPAPRNDKCEQAEAQFMAVLLNRASTRLSNSCCVAGDDGNTTSGAVVAAIEELLGDPGRTFDDCVEAQALAADLNEGDALCDNQ